MAKSYSKDPEVDRSLKHSVKDGVAFSVMSGGGETYFSAYALFHKATSVQIGWLAALPPLLGSFSQLFSAWWGRKTGERKKIILAGAYIQAFSWVPLAILPAIFPEYAVSLIIASIVVFYIGGNMTTPQWSSLMGDLVPERKRGRFFSRRTQMASITSFIALVSAGGLLHLFEHLNYTLMGYWILFFIAAGARLVSIHHLSEMHDPPGHVAAMEGLTGKAIWVEFWQSPFSRFAVFFALMQFSVSIASPFFSVYVLRDLHFSYLQYMTVAAVVVLVQFLTLARWGRIGDAFGNRLILVVTGILIPLLPALWMMSTQFWWIVSAQLLSGLVWAGFSLSATNYAYDLIPRERRATFLAMQNVMASAGICIGALLGGYLGAVLPQQWTWMGVSYEWFTPLYWVFLLSFIVRASVAAYFLPSIREVREVRNMPVSTLIFRVGRFNALAGLIFDVVGSIRSSKKNTLPRLIPKPIRTIFRNWRVKKQKNKNGLSQGSYTLSSTNQHTR